MAGQDYVGQWEYTKEHCTDGDELALCNAMGKEGSGKPSIWNRLLGGIGSKL